MRAPRVAVVTGATSGIGRAICEKLTTKGYQALGTGRRGEILKKMHSSINKRGEKLFVGMQGDSCDPHHIKSSFYHATDFFGNKPSIYVISAGRGLPGTLLKSDDTLWEQLIKVNLLAVMRQLKQAVNMLLEHSCSELKDVVVVGSVAGSKVSATNPVYGATKFALHSLTEALRQEVCQENIRVTLVQPGFVKTEFQTTAKYDTNWFNSLEKDMGPFLSAHDVAELVEFVVAQPPHVHLSDIQIRPTRQTL